MKTEEKCPECSTPNEPTDRVLPIETADGSYPIKLWRYKCGCGWVWANEAQRKHNEVEHRRAQRKAKERMYE